MVAERLEESEMAEQMKIIQISTTISPMEVAEAFLARLPKFLCY